MKKQYDMIIVGCGVAGCFTALNLPQNKEILMISKGEIEESDSFLAQGGICVLKDENDYDSFFEDTMKAGHYENRKEAVDIMIRSSRDIIQDLISYGVEFNKENGELVYTREGAHSTNRILYHDDITGKEITSKLLDRVRERSNITLMTNTAMVDILCRENCCDGILLRLENGEIRVVFADRVMWACGGLGGIYENSTNYQHLTGDALALSLRHNIRLQNINYVQIHPTTLYSKKKERRFLISESVRGEGAHLYDKDGNRFVDELLPRDLLSQEIRKQMKKDGTDYVWLSMLPIEDLDITVRFPNIYRKCLEEGYDVTKEWIPVVPAQHYFMGGVYVDADSHTSMKHLYAAGETSCNGVHGANRLASNSLLESLVFAKRAAIHMIQDEPKRNLEEYMNMSLEELAQFYELNLDGYADLSKFESENKQKIWAEIDRQNALREEMKNEFNNK